MPIADLYTTCGPWVHPDTIAAVVAVESGGHPFAIGTPHGASFPRTHAQAERVLDRALRSESSVDIGLMQINSQWLPKLRIPADALLDPCTNVRVGAAILARNFVAASRPGRTHLQALIAALSMFNSGSETAAMPYVERVLSMVSPRTRKD